MGINMKEILKIIFFSCLISVSYGASADEWDEMKGRLKEQMDQADYNGMGPNGNREEYKWEKCKETEIDCNHLLN
ncbi:uncharacterized protein EpC_32090 [Erwinia pyrifoliae Ep1/96]|nr:hypothetical protein CPI84_02335 [Erwinia pyrifoliae]MCA8874829.1 hypothetical protein [Erwinia pyrifoliae]CAX56988.1 uncharacterized protein EpC_32090 [Erwinia pyrifoliae Ep1/96]